MPELTMADYVEGNGNFCPKCGSNCVDREEYIYTDDTSGTTLPKACCLNCNYEWHEVWCLTGYEKRS